MFIFYSSLKVINKYCYDNSINVIKIHENCTNNQTFLKIVLKKLDFTMKIINKSGIFNFANGDVYAGRFNINLNTNSIYRHGTPFH